MRWLMLKSLLMNSAKNCQKYFSYERIIGFLFFSKTKRHSNGIKLNASLTTTEPCKTWHALVAISSAHKTSQSSNEFEITNLRNNINVSQWLRAIKNTLWNIFRIWILILPDVRPNLQMLRLHHCVEYDWTFEMGERERCNSLSWCESAKFSRGTSRPRDTWT